MSYILYWLFSQRNLRLYHMSRIITRWRCSPLKWKHQPRYSIRERDWEKMLLVSVNSREWGQLSHQPNTDNNSEVQDVFKINYFSLNDSVLWTGILMRKYVDIKIAHVCDRHSWKSICSSMFFSLSTTRGPLIPSPCHLVTG